MPIEHRNNFYKYLKEKSLQLLCFLKCLTDSVTIRFMILRPLTTRGHPLTTWTLALHSLLHSTSDYNSHHPLHWTRGLHGLKTEARTRPIPEIVWPDPTWPDPARAAQLNLEPEPDPKSPPPTPQRITQKKGKRLHFTIACKETN